MLSRFKVIGQVIELKHNHIVDDGKEKDFYHVVIEYPVRSGKRVYQMGNAWLKEVKEVCKTLKIGDTVNMECTVASERNNKNPDIFFHKVSIVEVTKIG